MRRTQFSRRGFTLVELLIVIGVSLALAALAAGVGYSGMIGSQRTVSSADRVSGWLILAKQRALRDGRPSGVRFIGTRVGSTNLIAVTEAQYIEQPEPYVLGNGSSTTSGTFPPPRLLVVRPVASPPDPLQIQLYFASQNPSEIDEFIQRVHQGDRIRLTGLLDASYTIVDDDPVEVVNPVTGDPGFNAPSAPGYRFLQILISNDSKLDLARRLGAAYSPSPTQSAIVFSGTRGTSAGTGGGFSVGSPPQPILGEPLLQITDPMMIDWRDPLAKTPDTPTTSGVTVTSVAGSGSTSFDILFNPSGSLVGTNGGVVCLWLRHKDRLRDETGDAAANPRTANNFDKAGQQLLVVISSRTGLISTQPVNDVGSPYLFATDGKNNGV